MQPAIILEQGAKLFLLLLPLWCIPDITIKHMVPVKELPELRPQMELFLGVYHAVYPALFPAFRNIYILHFLIQLQENLLPIGWNSEVSKCKEMFHELSFLWVVATLLLQFVQNKAQHFNQKAVISYIHTHFFLIQILY